MPETSTSTRPEPEAELEELEDRVETMEETIVRVAEALASHLRGCPGATEDELLEADALAARWAANLR